MKIKNLNLFLLAIFVFGLSLPVSAQGCSDAGFCSVSNGFLNQEDNLKNNFETGFVFGIGDQDVTNYSLFMSYTRTLSDRFDISTKITSAAATGSFGTNTNLGDFFLTTNYNITTAETKSGSWSVFLGAKIPFTKGNDQRNGYALPMPYQSSLGTFDAIGGVNYMVKKWDFNAAFQIPLTQNSNTYQQQQWVNSKFESTNLFQRKPDLLFRSGYRFKTANQKFTLKPNLLFIYHLGEDSFQNLAGQRQNIVGSDGLTLNANAILTYKLGANSYLETSLAAPLVIRTQRPDGLTRAFTAGFSYKINF